MEFTGDYECQHRELGGKTIRTLKIPWRTFMINIKKLVMFFKQSKVEATAFTTLLKTLLNEYSDLGNKTCYQYQKLYLCDFIYQSLN